MELEYVSAKKGAELLGIHWSHFPHVADAAKIRRRRLPGMQYIRYNLEDIQRTAKESHLASDGSEQPNAQESTTTPAKSAKSRPGPSRQTTAACAEEAS